MFYKPTKPETGHIWDTWLYLHEGVYYLYYLAATRRPTPDQPWDNTSLATSTDGVHWTEVGPIVVKKPEATWMGTGSTWANPTPEKGGSGDGKRFQMNFSEWTGPRQTIFFAESDDLQTWTRLGDEYEFVQDERWYHPEGRWDCIWTIDRPGGGLYGYWTATANNETDGQFGFGESEDGLHWAALKPPVVYGFDKPDAGGEVGAIEKFGDKYFMMFGYGQMHTLLADDPAGPFHMASVNTKLLGGHTYFSRFLATDDDLLVNHHSICRDGAVYMAPLKRAEMDADGAIRLMYWDGNDALKGDAFNVASPAEVCDTGAAMLPTTFDSQTGFILEGDLTLPATGEPARGLYIECEPGKGSAILIDPEGVATLGDMNADGSDLEVLFTENRECAFGSSARFRLMLQRDLIEFYLDDVLIECFSLPSSATGQLGVITDDASAITNFTAHRTT
jgi:hypothetical protein